MPSAVSLGHLHAFFRQLAEPATHAVMLGGAVTPSALNRWVMIGLHARQTISLQGQMLFVNGKETQLSGMDAIPRLFGVLESLRQACRTWPELQAEASLPMVGGLMGCLGYGFHRWCDEGWQHLANMASETDWPDLIFCEFEDWLLIDLASGRLVVLSDMPEREAQYFYQWNECRSSNEVESAVAEPSAEELASYLSTFEASFTPSGFAQAVDRLKRDIAQGELYQANLSICLQKTLPLDPHALFAHLCRSNPSPFSGFFKWPDGVIVCNSPERLVQVNETGHVQTRPIAGTRGRGQTHQEDDAIGHSLHANPKERAEHLMLVDLARNDLGRVCTAGSVTVDELLVLERYSHVTHLVSNVTGQIRPEQTGWDVLRALFPGGTITGCPKIRCVETLANMEPVPRGFYTGGMGYLDAASGAALDFNILIRSLFLRPMGAPLMYNASLHVGAGIVHDAVGAHEYRECLRKAAASLGALYQLERLEQQISYPQL